MWLQQSIVLRARPRGVHLVTNEILSALRALTEFRVGLCHLLLQHTSASLALNENADPDVRADLGEYLERLVPEGQPFFRHTTEGDDDMPAHIKTVLVGSTLTLPLTNGRINLGTWQGIYLCEHRDHGGARTILATAWGERDAKNL